MLPPCPPSLCMCLYATPFIGRPVVLFASTPTQWILNKALPDTMAHRQLYMSFALVTSHAFESQIWYVGITLNNREQFHQYRKLDWPALWARGTLPCKSASSCYFFVQIPWCSLDTLNVNPETLSPSTPDMELSLSLWSHILQVNSCCHGYIPFTVIKTST